MTPPSGVNLQKAVACRTLFQDEHHSAMIKLSEKEKQEWEEAAKQFLVSMQENELAQAMAQSTPVMKAKKTHFEKRKSKPELLLQRSMRELSEKKSAKKNKTIDCTPLSMQPMKRWACLQHD